MKRTILATLVVATMISCSNEEVLDSHREAILFDNTFVDKATRTAIDGSYTTGSLSKFQAYGTITTQTGTANIFEGELVTKGGTGVGTNWTYDSGNTQYWIPGNTYNFCAIADGNIENVTTVEVNEVGMPTAIQLLDAEQQKDILYAESEPIPYTNGAKSVSFTFRHLLAKAKFTVKNEITTNNGYSYKVSNITLNDIPQKGKYTIGTGWTETENDELDLSFGNAIEGTNEVIAQGNSMESNYERLLIPVKNATLTITFGYQLLKGEAVIDTQTKTVNAYDVELKEGCAYNFIITLGNPGEPITFNLQGINAWTNEEGEEGEEDKNIEN